MHLSRIWELSPHWGPEEPSGVQSSLYVCPSVSLSVSLSGRPRQFLAIIKVPPVIACSACSRRPLGKNTLSCSIICPSVRPVVCGNFEIFVFILISSVGVQNSNVFISQNGFLRTPVRSSRAYISVCQSLRLFISLSGPLRHFLVIKAHGP